VSLSLWLRLGRVSNLPTVWSNVLAGLALVGALEAEPSVLVAALALSIFYVGGMYLNDAFDRNIDRVERPTRPIPAGQVSARAVFTLGFAALAIGTAWLAWRFIEEPVRHWSRRFAPPPAGRSAVAQVSAI